MVTYGLLRGLSVIRTIRTVREAVMIKGETFMNGCIYGLILLAVATVLGAIVGIAECQFTVAIACVFFLVVGAIQMGTGRW